MEEPHPILRKILSTNAKAISESLVDARHRITKVITDAARSPNIGNIRHTNTIVQGIQAQYGALGVKLDEAFRRAIGSVAKAFHGLAGEDIKRTSGDSITRYDPQYANDIFARIHPGSGSTLAAVKTTQMAASDIAQLRSAMVAVQQEGALLGWTARQRQAEMMKRVIGVPGQLNSWQFIDASGRKWKSSNYFNMLNRTTLARTARDTYHDSLITDKLDLVAVQNAGDPCPVCRAWSGVIYSITGNTKGYPSYADAVGAGVWHPNCCLPETMVYAPDVKGAYKSEYSGDVIKVSVADGEASTVTINHIFPVVRCGVVTFVKASEIKDGDHLIRYNLSHRSEGSGPDVDRNQARIDEVFITLSESGSMDSVSVPASPEHLHGDGKAINGKIDIIHPKGFLMDNGQLAGGQPFAQSDLQITSPDLLPFSGDSTLRLFLLRMAASSGRIVRRHRDSVPVGVGPILVNEQSGFGAGALDYSSDFEASVDGAPANPVNLGELQNAFPGEVSLSAVLSVERFHYSGPVYDLMTKSTLYTMSGGIASSNCVCVPRYVDSLVDKKSIKAQKGTPNPEAPTRDEWNAYARRIEQEARPEIGIRRPLTPALKDPPKVDLAASAPAFVPAKTVKDAEEWAKNNNITVIYGEGTSLEYANGLNKGLFDAKNAGVPVEVARWNTANLGKTIGGDRINAKSQLGKPNIIFNNDQSWAENQKGMIESGKPQIIKNPETGKTTNIDPWTSTQSEIHTIVHETAHQLHWAELGKVGRQTHAFNNWKARDWSPEHSLSIDESRGVSEYAAASPFEFVAEVYTKYKLNPGPMPLKVKTLYNNLNGPAL